MGDRHSHCEDGFPLALEGMLLFPELQVARAL